MGHPKLIRWIVLALAALLALACAVLALERVHSNLSARVQPASAWAGMMDYFIQDVCLDKDGHVMMGVSPIDGNPGCVSHRDLLPGERLPYHKEDPRGSGDSDRLDELPVDTGTPLGVIAIKIKDNYAKDGKTANVLDIGDGLGNIYLQSSTTISAYSTIDANGPTYHVSSSCTDGAGGIPGDIAALFDTKVRVTTDALATTSGSYTTDFAKVYNPGSCLAPQEYVSTSVDWKIASYSYTRPDGTKTPPLETLISTDAPDGPHVERYYQTKEVGRIRYEAWQDLSKEKPSDAALFQAAADKIAAAGGDCAQQYEPPPAGPDKWVLFECGEWTTITPPSDMQNGDYPDQWITALKTGDMTAELFGLKPTDVPTIASATPTTFAYGTPATITFTGNFTPHDAQGQVIVMVDGGSVHSYETPTDGDTKVTYQVSWDTTRKGHELTGGTHVVHIFDGVSMSNPIVVTVTGGVQHDKSKDAGNVDPNDLTSGLDE
jgi:hypothetical protein